MKMMAFLLIVTGVQAVAGPSDAQYITLSGKDMPLREVFRKIRKQTDFQFFYKDAYLRMAQPVDLQVQQAGIEEVLDDCFARQPLTYKIVGDVVVVSPKPKQPEITRNQKLQIPVRGTVVDSATGEPLAGVTVQVKDGSQGTVTDASGHFSLDAPEGTVLVVSYLGYKPREITARGGDNLKIILVSATTDLEQLVVVGYGTQKKVNLTGAVSVIDAEEVSKRAVNNAVQALQGMAPNLNIAATTEGGAADASMSLNIRGTGSLSSSAPYILIDGVRATQAELAALNPADIADISVLKDAASAAIYGAQAAYGVILIKTKEGSKDQKFRLSLSSNIRFKQLIFVPKSVNSLTYAEEVNEASMNYSDQKLFDDQQMAKIRDFLDGKEKYGTAADPNNANQWLGVGAGTSNDWFAGYANTDWWDVMFKDVGFSQKHNISITGGTQHLSYYLSGGIFQDPGMLHYGNENEHFTRYNLNSTISTEVTQWLTLSNTTRFYQENNAFPATLEGGSRARLYHDIMRWPPLVPLKTPPVKDADGNIVVPEQLTTLAAFNEYNGFNAYQTDNMVSTFNATIKLMDGLSLKGDYTFKKQRRDRTLNYKKWTFYGPDGKPSIVYQANDNQILKEWRRTNYTSFNIYADFDHTFLTDHHLHVLMGFQQEENHYDELQAGRKDVIANNLSSINVAAGDIIGPDNPISAWATMGAFGRLSYNYKEKYLLEFNGRYDGSSKFAKGHRFGFFPSLSTGYNIYKEDFWQPLEKVINVLKIRASYGKLGNQNVDGNLYLSSIPIQIQLPWVIGGERPVYTNIPSIISPYVTWETATTQNLGVDMGFLNHRLTASFDIYRRQTDHMFGPLSALPATLGAAAPKANSASLRTRGWELVIGWKDQTSALQYHVNVMFSDNVSKIIRYNNDNNVLSDWYEGQIMGEIWGFAADALFQSESEVEDYTSQVDLSYFGTGWQPGDVKYKDLNGDGKVDVGENTREEPGDQIVIGNDHPRYAITIQGGLTWRNFDFSMLWQGIGKRDLMLDNYATLFWGWNSKGHSRITEASLDHWSKDNPDGYLPIPLINGGRSGFAKDRFPSTRYLLNGAYIRLKNLNIGYSLPSAVLKNLKIASLRFYVSGENLLTLTNMWPTLDPELAAVGKRDRTSDGRDYPLSRAYTFGFNITF